MGAPFVQSVRQQWFDALSWDRRLTTMQRAAALTIGSLADEAGEAAVIGRGRLARVLSVNTSASGRTLRTLADDLGLIAECGRNEAGEAVWRLTTPGEVLE